MEDSIDSALAAVVDWGGRNKLAFAPHKTSAMVITRRLKYDRPRLIMAGRELQLVEEFKVLVSYCITG